MDAIIEACAQQISDCFAFESKLLPVLNAWSVNFDSAEVPGPSGAGWASSGWVARGYAVCRVFIIGQEWVWIAVCSLQLVLDEISIGCTSIPEEPVGLCIRLIRTGFTYNWVLIILAVFTCTSCIHFLFHELPVVGREQAISLDGGAPVARNTLELGSEGRSSWDAFAWSCDKSFNDRLACLIAIASAGDVIRREIFQAQQCGWAFALASLEVALAGKSSRTDAAALFIRSEDFHKLVVRNLLIWDFTRAADGEVEIFATECLVAVEQNEVSISFVELRDEVFVLNCKLTRDGAVWLHRDLWRDENFPVQRKVDVLFPACWIRWQISLETGVFDDLLLLKRSDGRLYLSSRLL